MLGRRPSEKIRQEREDTSDAWQTRFRKLQGEEFGKLDAAKASPKQLAELKRRLKERGMSTKGSKATLRLRLLEAAAEGPPSSANLPDEGGGGGGGGRGGCASVLHQAAALGKASQLRKLLGDGAAKALLNTGDERQYTHFHVACAGGHADCVRLLLEAGCDQIHYVGSYED